MKKVVVILTGLMVFAGCTTALIPTGKPSAGPGPPPEKEGKCEAYVDAEWRPVDHSEFDAARITHISSSVVRVLERTVLPEEVLKKLRKDKAHDYSDYSYTINCKRINCRKRTIGGAGSTDYNSRGCVIQYFDETNVNINDIQMLPAARSSRNEALLKTVCDYVNKPSRKKKRR